MNEPEKKIVKFPVWDMETDEIIEMEMNEEDYNDMIKAEEEQEKKSKKALESDDDAWRYAD